MTDGDGSTGADLFLAALESYGVTHLFGNPGTTELPIMRAVARSDLEYVLGLHEDVAVGMAAGYASTRRYHAHHRDEVNPVGVVNLHVAPGMAHGLGNLQNAAVSGVPLVVTAGNHATGMEHEEPILSGDMVTMTEEYTKWSAEVRDVSALPTMVRRAVKTALTPPTGPVFLGLPIDVMMAETDAQPERLGTVPDAGRGDPESIARAAEILVDADDPLLVVGDGVARAGPDAIEAAVRLAEASGAPVYSEMITAEVSFPPDHDQWVSFTPPTTDAAEEFFDGDAIVFVGCSTNAFYLPHDEPVVPPETTTVHVGDDAWELGKNEPADVTVVGDPGRVLDAVADEIAGAVSDDRKRRRLDRIGERRRQAERRIGGSDPDPDDGAITKPRLADALASTADGAFVVNESNTSKYSLLSRWSLGPERFLANKNGGLGYGLPATLGAAIAWDQHPDPVPVVGFVGDGSYLYYPQTLYSAARYDLDLTVVVPNNRNYRILKDGMLAIYGGTDDDHEYVGMDIEPPVDLATNAESHGATGLTVADPDDLEATLTDAIERGGPVVVDVQIRD